MISWNKIRCVSIPCDLTLSTFQRMASEMKDDNDTPQFLVARQSDTLIAKEIAKEFGVDFIILPDAIMVVDSWAVFGEQTLIWSPGA